MTVERGAGRIPLYEQVTQALAEDLSNNTYTPGGRFLTEREVCERFGVSTTTAVRALNALVGDGLLVRRQGSGTFVADRPPASMGPDSMIPGPAEGMGTDPATNAATDTDADSDPRGAGSLGGGRRQKTVACILQYVDGTHVTQLLGGLEATCNELGYRMFLTHTENSGERETQAIRSAIAADVSGIVLYPAERGADPALFAEARQQGIPLVTVDRYRTDVATDAVVADNLAVGYEVTRKLIQLGHERIALLCDETDCTSVRDRLAGHLKALRDHQVPTRPELTVLRRYVRPTHPTEDGLVASLLDSPDPPTVLLCGNGFALAQAVEDLVALGHDVPGDIDLAGMDDAGPFDIFPLTAVAAALPSREMGERAARLLHTRMSSGEPYRDMHHVVLPIRLRTRQSAPGYLRVVTADTP
ncbi:GntR family transcriptional regulator [Actinopolymorpha sp. B17G11]|uniref:GntR family transcriptional regulator n=1 Tax=Actinopolymorpha sp. B17G11 TaxID=3160861 RepID=UPI0032E49833